MKILLIGATGQVGYELLQGLQPLGQVTATVRPGTKGPPDYPLLTPLDLTDSKAIQALVNRVEPDLIINAAAYTQVDRAESEARLAHMVNANAPGELAKAALRVGAPLIHYSTDYVFDGTKKRPYNEDDKPNPINVYGKTKLAGEKAIIESGASYLIFRTSWVYSARGNNFLKTMLRLAREREEISVVSDQQGSPTSAPAIAAATCTVISQAVSPDGVSLETFFAEKCGLYHVTAGGDTSWYGFAKAIFLLDSQRNEHRVRQVKPISTMDYSTPARRPAYSVLSSARAKERLEIVLESWEDGLRDVLSRVTR